MTLTPRFFPVYIFCVVAIFAWFFFAPSYTPKTVLEFKPPSTPDTTAPPEDDGRFNWALRKERFPVSSMIPLPTGTPPRIPKIQYDFKAASEADAVETRRRRDAVKAAFNRAWEGYKSFAWMRDELAPISGTSRNHFGGWAATLVDSLDTLWIMDKMVDFDEAVADLKDIDFSTTEDEDINTFETTIRYLGGLLSAYDLSLGKYPGLLEKALELGHFLYAAFDTHNRMPITRWKWQLYGLLPLQIFRRLIVVQGKRWRISGSYFLSCGRDWVFVSRVYSALTTDRRPQVLRCYSANLR